MKSSPDENQVVLYSVSFQVPPDIVGVLQDVKKYLKSRYPEVESRIRTKIEITRFLSNKDNSSEIRSIVEDVASNFLPFSIPISFEFDINSLSVTNPHISLGTSDKAILKLLRLEESILEKVKPHIHIPETMPEGIHPKQLACISIPHELALLTPCFIIL